MDYAGLKEGDIEPFYVTVAMVSDNKKHLPNHELLKGFAHQSKGRTTGQLARGLGLTNAIEIMRISDVEGLLFRALDRLLAEFTEFSIMGGGIFLLDAQHQVLQLAAHRGDESYKPPCGNVVNMGQCQCGFAAHSGELVFNPHGEQEPWHLDETHVPPHGDVCVPLNAKEGGVVGVLHLCTEPGISVDKASMDRLLKECQAIAESLHSAFAVNALISQHKKLQEHDEEQDQKVHRLRLSLEHAKRAKSDFLSSVSHELRTPLNAIIGFSQVLQEEYFGGLNTKQKQYVTDILESGKHLLDLINDILDLSRVESGDMKLELEPLPVSYILESSLHLIKEKAFKHAIDIEVDLPEEARDLNIMADDTKLKQILFNLLSNAAKFTPDQGSICVGARVINDPVVPEGTVNMEDNPGWIEVFVRDTGIGIEGNDKKRVFDDFYQVSAGLSGKTPGTGLGLPLARRLVELHGGRIWVESEGRHQGSCFVFTLPIGICDWDGPDKQ